MAKEVITIKYEKNYNNKFYSTYFVSIRDDKFRVIEGNMYEIEVNGKIIGSAKLVRLELINFHEIPSFQMSIITGANQSGEGVLIQKNIETCLVYSKNIELCEINKVDKTNQPA